MNTSQMARERTSIYPEVIQSNPESIFSFKTNHPSSSFSNPYPTIDTNDLVENLFPDNPPDSKSPSAPPQVIEEVIVRIPGAILNLIDERYSVELASGDFTILRLVQGDNIVAVLARVADEIQWPLNKNEAAVKLDDSHYFFSLQTPKAQDSGGSGSDDEKQECSDDLLNYGLTIASKGQEGLVKELDEILKMYSGFSVQKISEKGYKGEALDGSLALETSPEEMNSGKKKELMEEQSAAYWTTLAPNVEDYSGTAAKMIAAGSGQLIKGILWCGDVTVERLKWGNEVLKKRLNPRSNKEISPETMKRIKRVKRVTRMTEKVATGVLSGVIKVSGFFTSSVANSKVGKKFFSLLPGEIILASLDGFNKVCDAAEVAGKKVMSTSHGVTTELVSQRYGEEAAKATSEGLGAAGHAMGTAWTAFKIRKALNPKSVLKSSSLAKSAAKATAAGVKSKSSKSN